VGLLLTVPGDAVVVPAGQIPVLPCDTYSAHAMYPASGYIDSVQATWTFPKDITCPVSGGNPRVAMWVGTWGDTASINDGTAWQARITTPSWNYFEYVMRAGRNGLQLASNSALVYSTR